MNPIATKPAEAHPQEAALGELLRLRLSYLPYRAYAVCVERLLRQLGYTNIYAPSRRSFRGPNRVGGVDLFATEETGLDSLKAIVLVKRFRIHQKVHRHDVCALRGTMLSFGSPRGLIITTGQFSEEARLIAKSFPGRPVRLIDGEELGQLMVQCRIGLVERQDLITGTTYLAFDEECFELLEGLSKGGA